MKWLKGMLFVLVTLVSSAINANSNAPLLGEEIQQKKQSVECEGCIKIEVASHSPAERTAYLTSAFDQLVNKLANNPNAAEKPDIVKAKANVLDYVLRYQYISEIDPLAPENKKLFLKVHFSDKSVQKLLQQAKLIAAPVVKQEAVQKNAEGVPQKNHNSFVLVVDNIDEVADYKEVLNYLSSLDAVSQIEVVQLAPPQVTFDITIAGGPEKLAQLIRLGDVLTPTKIWSEEDPHVATEEKLLKYWYQR